MSNETSKTGWQPVSPQEAEALWTKAQSAYSDIHDALRGTACASLLLGDNSFARRLARFTLTRFQRLAMMLISHWFWTQAQLDMHRRLKPLTK